MIGADMGHWKAFNFTMGQTWDTPSLKTAVWQSSTKIPRNTVNSSPHVLPLVQMPPPPPPPLFKQHDGLNWTRFIILLFDSVNNPESNIKLSPFLVFCSSPQEQNQRKSKDPASLHVQAKPGWFPGHVTALLHSWLARDLWSVGHGKFLEVLHEHLQADVICEHGRARCILAPREHVVVGLGRVHLGQQETRLRTNTYRSAHSHSRTANVLGYRLYPWFQDVITWPSPKAVQVLLNTGGFLMCFFFFGGGGGGGEGGSRWWSVGSVHVTFSRSIVIAEENRMFTCLLSLPQWRCYRDFESPVWHTNVHAACGRSWQAFLERFWLRWFSPLCT